MRKVGILLVATAASVLLPSVSMADCIRDGTISRVTVSSSGVASVYVKSSSPSTPTYFYTSASLPIITAALNAQASHQHVEVRGNAANCGPIVAGQSSGGTILAIVVS